MAGPELHLSLRLALQIIAGDGCTSFTSGPGSCWKQETRSPLAKYGADRWCDACIALKALQDSTEEKERTTF